MLVVDQIVILFNPLVHELNNVKLGISLLLRPFPHLLQMLYFSNLLDKLLMLRTDNRLAIIDNQRPELPVHIYLFLG